MSLWSYHGSVETYLSQQMPVWQNTMKSVSSMRDVVELEINVTQESIAFVQKKIKKRDFSVRSQDELVNELSELLDKLGALEYYLRRGRSPKSLDSAKKEVAFNNKNKEEKIQNQPEKRQREERKERPKKESNQPIETKPLVFGEESKKDKPSQAPKNNQTPPSSSDKRPSLADRIKALKEEQEKRRQQQEQIVQSQKEEKPAEIPKPATQSARLGEFDLGDNDQKTPSTPVQPPSALQNVKMPEPVPSTPTQAPVFTQPEAPEVPTQPQNNSPVSQFMIDRYYDVGHDKNHVADMLHAASAQKKRQMLLELAFADNPQLVSSTLWDEQESFQFLAKLKPLAQKDGSYRGDALEFLARDVHGPYQKLQALLREIAKIPVAEPKPGESVMGYIDRILL